MMFSQGAISLQPISSLSPFIGRWFIKARVLDKSPVRTWNNNKKPGPPSQGQLFSMTLVDENGDAIRATMFQAGVTKYNDLLQNGRVYVFSKGTVKTANKKFNQLPSDYEISFDDNCEITPAEDDDSIQRQKYNFIPVGTLPQKEKNSIVDICGVIVEAGETQQIITRTQERLDKRVLTIADHSGVKVDLTIWGQQARDFSAATGSVVAAKACRLGDYGGVSLSLTQQGSLSVEPDNHYADSVRHWVRQNNGNLEVTSITDRGSGETRSTERRSFSVIATEGLGLNPDKADFMTLRFTLVHVKADNMWYLACPDCSRKLLPQGEFPNVTYRCERCDANKIPRPRYILTCQAYDHTGSQQISAFQDVANNLLKIPADQLKQQEDERPGTCQELAKSLCFRQYIARIRVKEEGQADDKRLKCVLQSCSPVNVATESTVLLRQIKRYLAL